MAEKTRSFEENISALEEVVNRLERGDDSLEESLSLFEQGVKLSKDCSAMLDNRNLNLNRRML